MCSLFGRLLSDMWKVTKGLKYPDFTDLLCPPGGKKSVLHFTQSLMGNFVSPDSTVCSLDSPQDTGCQFLLILGLKNIISILIIDIFRCWSWYIKKAIHRYFTWIITSSTRKSISGFLALAWCGHSMRIWVLFSISWQPLGKYGEISVFNLLVKYLSLLWPLLSLRRA